MFIKTFFVSLAVILVFTTVTEAVALMRSVSQLRCNCIKLESQPISLKLIARMEILPSGPHCRNVEVIVTLKNEDIHCIDPSAPWIQKIIKKTLQIQENNEDPTPSL